MTDAKEIVIRFFAEHGGQVRFADMAQMLMSHGDYDDRAYTGSVATEVTLLVQKKIAKITIESSDGYGRKSFYKIEPLDMLALLNELPERAP